MPKQRPQPNKNWRQNRLIVLIDSIIELTGEELKADYNSAYGGFRLVRSEHHGRLEESRKNIALLENNERLDYREMVIRLQGIADGIRYVLNK